MPMGASALLLVVTRLVPIVRAGIPWRLLGTRSVRDSAVSAAAGERSEGEENSKKIDCDCSSFQQH